MNDQSVGYRLERLFIGCAILLASDVLDLLNIAGVSAGILRIVGIIITMIALSKLNPWDPGYGRAFQWEIISLVFAVISVVLVFVAALTVILLWVVGPVIMAVSVLLDYLVVHNLCQASANLTGDAGDLNTAALGATTDKVYLLCCGVGVCCNLVQLIPVLGAVLPVELLAELATTAGWALVVYFLYRAKTSLS